MGTGDRRGKRRVPAEYKVDCIHTGDFIISLSRDISADGMFICTEHPPAVGQKLILKFSIDGLEDLEVAGRVAWVNTAGEQRCRGMGIKFIKPRVSTQREILQAVHKVAILEGVA